MGILEQEIGMVFAAVLKHAGVYPCEPEEGPPLCDLIDYVNQQKF